MAGLLCLGLTSCGTIGVTTSSNSSSTSNVLGSVLENTTNANTIGNVLSSILGIDRPTEQQLIGTWRYNEPGVAFTSENTLAKAGGEVAAAEIRNRLKERYSAVGLSSSNTQITFNNDHTFTAKIAGRSVNGTYSYDENNSKLMLNTYFLTIPCYAKKTLIGMSYLFESKKLLPLLQMASTLSGNSTVQTIGDLSKNYDGVRIGFDTKK